MFFICGLLAAVMYALQNALMVKVFRDSDVLSAVAYRAFSLGISMSPLLFLAEIESREVLVEGLGYAVAAGAVTVFANWNMSKAVRHIQVGLSHAVGVSGMTIFTAALAWAMMGETLSSTHLVLMCLLIAGIMALSYLEAGGSIPDEYNVRLGIALSVAFAVFISIGFFLMGTASRVLDPFIAGYVWEVSIGVFALLLAMGRRTIGHPGFERISWKQFLDILLRSSPTCIATALYASAITMGPLALATILISTQMLFVVFFAFLLYNERFSKKQWSLVLYCFLVLAALKMSGL